MSDRSATGLSEEHRRWQSTVEARLAALETRRAKFGDYFIDQTGDGLLVARHARTQHTTTIATP